MHCLRTYNGDRRFIWPQPQCGHDSVTSGSWGYIWCQAGKYVPMFGEIPGDWLIFPIVNHVVLWYVLSQIFFPFLGCIYHLFYKGVCFYSHISYCSALGCEDFCPRASSLVSERTFRQRCYPTHKLPFSPRSYSEVRLFKAQWNVSELWRIPSETLHCAALPDLEGNPQLQMNRLFLFQNRLVALLLQWVMEAVHSSAACCGWQPNVNRSSSWLEQARGVVFPVLKAFGG